MSITKGIFMCTHETVAIIHALISAFLSSCVSCHSRHIRTQSHKMMSQFLKDTKKTMYYVHMYISMHACMGTNQG